MIAKKNRIDCRAIEKIWASGKVLHSLDLSFRFILSSAPLPPRISFVAPKSVAKLAVRRNKLRRLGYTAARKYIPGLPAGLLGAFIFKKYQDSAPELENEIKTILDKIR